MFVFGICLWLLYSIGRDEGRSSEIGEGEREDDREKKGKTALVKLRGKKRKEKRQKKIIDSMRRHSVNVA